LSLRHSERSQRSSARPRSDPNAFVDRSLMAPVGTGSGRCSTVRERTRNRD
jgi:hypothetical protein